ncbi:MAG: hypothetical protein FJ044_03515 [Candidatus Cloacimonetes bacterium]|nr:hypothetical protein [Candidatus Cloacimonadota bacterium]
MDIIIPQAKKGGMHQKLAAQIAYGPRNNEIYRKYLEGKTLEEIGKDHELSRQWIHQIIQKFKLKGGEKE